MNNEKEKSNSKYVQQYIAKKYKTMTIRFKPHQEQKLAEYSTKTGLSANQILIRAMLYCKMYDIDLTAINPDK